MLTLIRSIPVNHCHSSLAPLIHLSVDSLASAFFLTRPDGHWLLEEPNSLLSASFFLRLRRYTEPESEFRITGQDCQHIGSGRREFEAMGEEQRCCSIDHG